MSPRITVAGLQIAQPLYDLVHDEIVPGTGISSDHVWQGFADMLRELAPRNRALLARRDELQARIDAWHLERKGRPHDAAGYKQYLIDRLPAAGGRGLRHRHRQCRRRDRPHRRPATGGAGKQRALSLNAANARWGSLFDALYGTDVIPDEGGAGKNGAFNPVRGAKVIAYAKAFLDEAAPLREVSYIDAIAYSVKSGQLSVTLSSAGNRARVAPAPARGPGVIVPGPLELAFAAPH